MAKKAKRSFGEKLAAAQQSSFVGRKAQLDKFRENINLGAEHDNFLNIFNIHGQGGVGKSTLLQEYARIARGSGYVLASIDTETRRLYEVTATMSSLAEQLDQAGGDFAKFHKTYKTYLQEKGKLESDPESPKGSLGTLIGGGLQLGGRVAREALPGASLFVSDDLLKSTAKIGGEWADFAYRKLTNKDEVKLVLEPLEVLTPLWVEAFNNLLEKKNVFLSFDTYEAANSELDQWLIRLLKEEFGELEGANFLVVIAGRSPLDSSYWHDFNSIMLSFLLDRFTEEEATSYLQKRGITNQTVITEILAISNCLPVYLALLGDTGSNEESGSIQGPNDKVVARFLKHISDPVLKLLATRAALPRRLNQDVIATLLADQQSLEHTSQALFDWLTNRPFIKKRDDHWTYHPIVRESIQRYLRERSGTEWEAIHQALSSFYHDQLAKLGLEEEALQFADEDWRLGRTEEIFHLLCQNYKQHIKLAVEFMVTALRFLGPSATSLLVEALVDREKNGNIVEGWGRLFKQGLAAWEKNEYQYALFFFTKIIAEGFLNDHLENSSFIWFLQGYCYDEIEQYDQAIQAFTKAIELKPNFTDAYNNMGLTFQALKKNDLALHAYTKAIEIEPNNPVIHTNIGNVYQDQENYDQAIQAYTIAIKLKPDDFYTYTRIGTAYDKQGDYDQALQAFTKAVKLKPDSHYVYTSIGITYFAKGDYNQAVQALTRAIELQPDSFYTYYFLGNAFFDMKKYPQALQAYIRGAEFKPDYADTYIMIGNAYTEQENYDQATQAFNKAIELGSDADAYFSMGNSYNKQGSYDKAIEAFTKAIELKPNYAYSYYNMGNIYDQQGSYDKAIEAFTKAIELKPDYAHSYYNIGNSYDQQGNYDKAIEAFTKAIELQPDNADAYFNMGNAYNKKENYDKAIETFTKVIELQPDDADAYFNMGNAYNKKENYNQAAEAYIKAIELQPDNANFYNNIGLNFQKQEKYDKAIHAFARAIELKPDYAYSYFNMGNVYVKKGSYDKAVEAFTKVIELQPDTADAWNSLGWTYLLLNQIASAQSCFQNAWEISEEMHINSIINLGHSAMLCGNYEDAEILYRKSIPLWADTVEFWQVMSDDFTDLKMDERGITAAAYQEMIARLRES